MLTEVSGPGDHLFNDISRQAEQKGQSWAAWEWKRMCNKTWGKCITGYGPEWDGDLPPLTMQTQQSRT